MVGGKVGRDEVQRGAFVFRGRYASLRTGRTLALPRDSVQAQQQAEQQRAYRQRHPQRFEAAQFGVGVAIGGVGAGHFGVPAGVGYISLRNTATWAAHLGRLAAHLWQNAGNANARLAPAARA